MESLARLIIILFICHFIFGACTSGLVLLAGNHLNAYVKNILLILLPIIGSVLFKFPFNVSFILGSLIPSSCHWILQ